ncbi:MAG: phage holin family protein [Thiobacillus sp.]
MAEESQTASGGLFESLKTLSVSLVGIVHTRLELLSTDIAEEREHLITLLLLVQLALFFLGVGILLLALLIVVAFWESHRLLALGGLTGLFLLASTGMAWLAVHKTRTRPRLFEASLAELSKDRQHLTTRS